MSAEVKLSAPWVTYFKMVYNVLTGDPEIDMPDEITDEGEGIYSFYIASSNCNKIIALAKILKNEIVMGNITIKIYFRCSNDADFTIINNDITVKDYKTAFKGNKYFKKIVAEKMAVGEFDYAVFAREIITFYNDNCADYHSNSHYIVADIIKEITNSSDVMPCTYFEADTDDE